MPPSRTRQRADEGLDQRLLDQVLTVELLERTRRQAAAGPREPAFSMALELCESREGVGAFIKPPAGEERCGF